MSSSSTNTTFSKSQKVIQYYMDANRTEKAPTDEKGNIILKFGTCLQGVEKRIHLFAYNTIEYDIELEPLLEPNEPDLKIIRYPGTLRAGAIEEVIISFKPDLDRVSSLNSGFDFRKIILTKDY